MKPIQLDLFLDPLPLVKGTPEYRRARKIFKDARYRARKAGREFPLFDDWKLTYREKEPVKGRLSLEEAEHRRLLQSFKALCRKNRRIGRLVPSSFEEWLVARGLRLQPIDREARKKRRVYTSGAWYRKQRGEDVPSFDEWCLVGFVKKTELPHVEKPVGLDAKGEKDWCRFLNNRWRWRQKRNDPFPYSFEEFRELRRVARILGKPLGLDARGERMWRAFVHHRGGSRRRGIEFLFTWEEWRDWWLVDDRWSRRGSESGLPVSSRLVMARHGDAGPYSPENVYCITSKGNIGDFLERNPDWASRRAVAVHRRLRAQGRHWSQHLG